MLRCLFMPYITCGAEHINFMWMYTTDFTRSQKGAWVAEQVRIATTKSVLADSNLKGGRGHFGHNDTRLSAYKGITFPNWVRNDRAAAPNLPVTFSLPTSNRGHPPSHIKR